MKKIISTLTISALALGSIFADVSLEYTQKGYISSNENGTSKKLDLNGYADDTTGDVVFSLSNETTGAAIVLNPWYAETGRQEVSKSAANNSKLLDQYYGWVKFFDGAMKLQSGVWATRSVNRLNQDAGTWEDTEYELYKYGVVGSAIASDITRLASVNGSYDGVLSTALSYDADSFYATGALITSAFNSSATTTTKSGFGLEVGAKLDEDTKVQAFLKSTTDQVYAVGVFLDKAKFSVKDFEFDLVTGATLGSAFGSGTTTVTDADGNSYALNNGLDFGFDLRLRYELSDTVSITNMNNVSYLGTAGEVINLWDMVSLAVQTSETIKFQVTGEWVYQDLDAKDAGYFSVTPGVTYTPVEGVDLTAGVIVRTAGWPHPSESSVSIPFILHVAL
ncbi:hypothetical protein [Treponema sp.]|uniref:hypothetical protein n=1 Tax=Treponema sp. TaxID=166 RepID=UPI00388E99FF